MLTLLALTLAQAAPLHEHSPTIDRVQDGLFQRQYIAIFNDKAPNFGDKETLSNWAAIHGVRPQDVNHYYAILPWFQGFGAWFTKETLKEILDLSIIKYVAEDTIVDLNFTTEPQLLKAVTKVPANPDWRSRIDWGQKRSNSRVWPLNTNPDGLYNPIAPARYASPYAPTNGTNSWGWKDTSYYTPTHGEDYCIWVIDTGVVVGHDEFAELNDKGEPTGKSRVDLAVNLVTGESDPSDKNGHGTHCAGTAAGNYIGVAYKAQIRSVRVLNAGGSGSWNDVVAGFNYVANNQVHGKGNIASVSLGGGAYQPVDDAVNAASKNGVICVIAAGNSNNNACGTNGVGGNSPARAEQAIAVAAADSSDNIASFSSYGPCIKSIAPGVTVCSAWIPPTSSPSDPDYYNDISGTSMATPHVAGAIACRDKQALRDPEDVMVDLALDQTPDKVGGLTGVKATTPNRYIFTQWKAA